MEWSNELILKFLELYQAESVIWDPMHRMHKNKLKVQEAWNRISVNLDNIFNVDELKAKKNSLMATFRSHRRKKQASMKSGAAEEDIYQPIWFAYQVMEDFLWPLYSCDKTINTFELDPDNALSLQSEEQQNEGEQPESTNEQNEATPHTEGIQHKTNMRTNEFSVSVNHRQKRRQIVNEINEAHKKIKQTFEALRNVMFKQCNAEEDDCDLYCKLLATKLRNYSVQERHILMHEIDGLLLNKLLTSSCYSSSSSSQSPLVPQYSVHVQNPNPPFSIKTYPEEYE